MPKRFLIVWAGFALLVSVEITGCSLIGFGVGSAIDAARTRRLHKGDRSQIFKLEPGSRLLVRMADGTSVAGSYRGLVVEPDSDYARRYAAWCDTAQLSFRPPRIGERIRIDNAEEYSMSAWKVQATFLGFGPKRLHYRSRRARPTYEPLKRIRRIVDSSGHVISKAAIEQVGDRLPVQLIAIVRQGGTERRIDLMDDRIVGLRFAEAHRGFRNAGLVVGIMADATLIVAAAALSSQPSSTSCEPTYTGGGYYSRFEIPARMDAMSDSIYLLPRESLALAR